MSLFSQTIVFNDEFPLELSMLVKRSPDVYVSSKHQPLVINHDLQPLRHSRHGGKNSPYVG